MAQDNFYIEYDEQYCVLEIKVNGRIPCPIAIESLRSNAAILDIIVQVSKKPWATDKMIGILVKKIDNLLNLQKNYCSGRINSPEKSNQEIKKLIQEN